MFTKRFIKVWKVKYYTDFHKNDPVILYFDSPMDIIRHIDRAIPNYRAYRPCPDSEFHFSVKQVWRLEKNLIASPFYFWNNEWRKNNEK